MKTKRSQKSSSEKESVTLCETSIAGVAESREPIHNRKIKSSLLLFLETPGGGTFVGYVIGAIILGVVGTLLGTALTALNQQYQNDREFKKAILKTSGDLELASSNESRSRELEIVSQAYDLLGRCITVSDDLILLTSPRFDPTKFEDFSTVKNQRQAMIANYNNCVKEWREKREKLKLLMSYYQQGNSEVIHSWQDAQDSATVYMECSQNWYQEHDNVPVNTEGACKSQREDYSEKVEALNVRFNKARHSSLKGWESPRQAE
ncbi:MAG TPA: hypothetical protein VKC61_20745 [Pyrinomonadaceae bacterium]|nr:hypothetical protein [Pyrinomonadaceae bacterium]